MVPPLEKKLCVLDLDHTILHMMKKSEFPTRGPDLSEDVVPFQHDGVDYVVALRIGATSLVTAMKDKDVKVVIVTCNLLGHQVMEALAKRCDVFDNLTINIITSREKGAKSLKALDVSYDKVVILDDSKSAWRAADANFVFVADRFHVGDILQADDEDVEDRELGYLTSIRDEINAFFVPALIRWDDGDEEQPPLTPRDRIESNDFDSAEKGTANIATDPAAHGVLKRKRDEAKDSPNARKSKSQVTK
ncbi:hypothetical protein M885DRAFT_514373 [Pelagophyceae sp. CCMP2097]|nr:hypothetical protein M885DRAFT_514373 [Pelagophyceae sp. CCMP2097]